MFQSKTLFVVGAGASAEAGLPVGDKLKNIIADLLNIQLEFNRQISGDAAIVRALREHVEIAEVPPAVSETYIPACHQIRKAMPQAPSIDTYIDNHAGNEQIALCGKLAIARSILEAERDSLLYIDPREQPAQLNYVTLQSTWYHRWFSLLCTGHDLDHIEQLFDNISFIIFNYDRCVENFLYFSLQNYYGIDENRSAELLRRVQFFHPYGSVGQLPWQNNDGATPFGGRGGGPSLLSIAAQIKTFTEQIEDVTAISSIQKLMTESEVIVFLGFKFHEPNMKLLRVPYVSQGKRVYSTSYGLSAHDRHVLRGSISKLFPSDIAEVEQYMEANLKCSEFFDEFGLALSH